MASTLPSSSSLLFRLVVLALAALSALGFIPPAATPAPGSGAGSPAAGGQPPQAQAPRTGWLVENEYR